MMQMSIVKQNIMFPLIFIRFEQVVLFIIMTLLLLSSCKCGFHSGFCLNLLTSQSVSIDYSILCHSIIQEHA